MKRKRLSDTDRQYIIDNYLNQDIDDIVKHINSTRRNVMYVAHKNGIVKRPIKKWDKTEIDFLRENYNKLTIQEICTKLNRSVDSIFQQVSYLGILKYFRFTKELLELEYLTNKQSVRQISDKYKVTEAVIYNYMKKFGIEKINRPRIFGSNHAQWSGYMEISGSHWGRIKSCAKYRGISFDIDIKDVWELFIKQDRKCALSGVEITFGDSDKNTYKNTNKNMYKNTTASLDRIDSSKGYTIDNVQWVHKIVNHMKLAIPEKEFLNWCKLIVNNKGIM